MEAALKNFEKMKAEHKIIFLGEMAELGEESDSEHKHIAELLNNAAYEKIVLVGKKFAHFSSMLKYIHFEDSQKASDWLKNNSIHNSHILIKGSRSTKMVKILEAL